MDFFSSLRSDLEALASGAASGFEKIETKIKNEIDAVEARVTAAFDAKLATLRNDLTGAVAAAPAEVNNAVKALTDKVASITTAPSAAPATPAAPAVPATPAVPEGMVASPGNGKASGA